MSRRNVAKRRNIVGDTRYNNTLLSRLINYLMRDGKKSLARKIVYDSFDLLSKSHNVDPFETFLTSMENLKPVVEVRSVRVGGSNYQVPSHVSERRGFALAINWLLDSAAKRSGTSMTEKLAAEIFDASNSRGSAIKKRDDTHKMAEANRAFSHFAQRLSGR